MAVITGGGGGGVRLTMAVITVGGGGGVDNPLPNPML